MISAGTNYFKKTLFTAALTSLKTSVFYVSRMQQINGFLASDIFPAMGTEIKLVFNFKTKASRKFEN